MTQTPTPNTPSAEALADITSKYYGPKRAGGISNQTFETICTALTAPIEKIERLDEALTRYEQDGIIYDDQDHNDRMIEPLYEAARLYDQGRTQSQIPEALRTLDWERDLDLLRAEVLNDVVATLRIDRIHQLIEALSATPPVTAPIEKVDGWLPIKGEMKGNFVVTNNLHAKDATGKMTHIWYTSFIQESSEPNIYGKYVCFDDADRKIHELTHYYEIAPPSARLQLQRQGD